VIYVSTAWLSEAGWALLEEAVRLSGFRRYAEVVRAAVNTAVVEIARGAGLTPPASVEVKNAPSAFQPQLGRLREVAVRLVSSVPLKRIQKWVAERLGASKASMGVALEWALATYVRVLRQKPAGLPEPVLGMLMQVYARVKSAPRSEKKAAALNELKLRLGTARELAKSLGLPVDKWWESIMEEAAAGDPEAVLRRYVEGGEVPRVRTSDRFAEAAALVLAEARDAEGLRRLWWLKRGLLLRAAESKAEKEIVKAVDMYVERDPEAAFKLLKAVERGERPPPPPPPPFDRAGFYASVRTRLETFDQIAGRILAKARDAGLPGALYGAGEYFRSFSRAAERDLKTMMEKAPPESREEDELRQKLEAALDAATAVAAAGAAAGLMRREVEALTELAVQKFLAYCRRYLGLPEPT
jgi:hypothetical protein